MPSTCIAASPAQARFLNVLLAERTGDAVLAFRARVSARHGSLTAREASSAIDWLKGQPRATEPLFPAVVREPALVPAVRSTEVRVTTPGVYRRTQDGVIFQVRSNREHTRLYAKRLTEITGQRLSETDEHVQIDFVYEAGAVYTLLASERLSVDEGKALTVRYGRCLACGRFLKAAQSVERGIGPVCIKSYA